MNSCVIKARFEELHGVDLDSLERKWQVHNKREQYLGATLAVCFFIGLFVIPILLVLLGVGTPEARLRYGTILSTAIVVIAISFVQFCRKRSPNFDLWHQYTELKRVATECGLDEKPEDSTLDEFAGVKLKELVEAISKYNYRTILLSRLNEVLHKGVQDTVDRFHKLASVILALRLQNTVQYFENPKFKDYDKDTLMVRFIFDHF